MLLLILKGKALFFIGLSALASGALIFLSKTDLLYPNSEQLALGSAVDIIVPDLVKAFIERFSSCGLYLAGGGLVLMILSLLFRKKADKE